MNTEDIRNHRMPEAFASVWHINPSCRAKDWLAIMAVTSTLLLSACGSLNRESAPFANSSSADNETLQTAAVSAVDRTIAADIIRTASQIFTPFSTTLQVSKNNDDPLLAYFIEQFVNAGFGVQRVSADQGSNFFSFTRTELQNDDGKPLVRFDSTIGAVDIGRDYLIPSANVISPASPVRLSGTRIPVSVPDKPNGRFQIQNPDNSSVVYTASLNLEQQAPPVISLITDDVVERVAAQGTETSSLQALNSSRVEINNLFYADQSNFSSVLDNYKQIERQIVVFGNDSMILGNTNKLLIEQFVQEQVNSDDLISLVGCSNGPTALEIGNEGLALGRATRVTEALLSQGIARDRILDEGCWAPVSAGDKFPARGVVLELWREVS